MKNVTLEKCNILGGMGGRDGMIQIFEFWYMGLTCSLFDCLNHHFENYCIIMIFIILISHQPHGLTKKLKRIYKRKDTPIHIHYLSYSFPSLCYSLLPCKTGARNPLRISPFQELKLPIAISQSIFDPRGSVKELPDQN